MTRVKNRIIISFLVICFVLLSVVATIAIVFALQQQNISTTLNISYTAVDIDGSVSATYKLGKNNTYGEATNLVPTADEEHISADGKSLVFYADDTDNAGTLEFPVNELEFTSQQSSMVIEYTFTNNGDVHYIASMSFDAELKYENMKVEYSINGEDYSEQRYAVVVPANSTGKSYWIRISIDKLTKNASLSGDFDWLLHGCDEKEQSYLTITSVEFKGSNGSYSASFTGEGEYVASCEIVFPEEVNGTPVTSIVQNTSITDTQKALVKSIFIPATVTDIGYNAFNGYSNLEEVIFEQNILKEEGNFSGTGLLTINMQAFYNCNKLKYFNMPSTINSIGRSAFESCSSLESIILPEGITSINIYTFRACSNLKQVKFLGNLTAIGISSFVYCSSLESIRIPLTVTSMGNSAFAGCVSLQHAYFENPYGWSMNGTAVDSEILLNPETAAQKLRGNNTIWNRTETTTETL